ncbi:MAG: hypothetical protein ACLR1T_12880 [Evtepia gabavorous]
MVRMYSALTWSTVSIRLAVSWSEVWRLFLGAMVRAMVVSWA